MQERDMSQAADMMLAGVVAGTFAVFKPGMVLGFVILQATVLSLCIFCTEARRKDER